MQLVHSSLTTISGWSHLTVCAALTAILGLVSFVCSAQAPARAGNAGGGPTSPGGVKRLMDLDALSGEIDADLDHMDGGVDSEMPSAEAGTTMTPDTTGEVASALGVLTGAAQAVGGLVSPGSVSLHGCLVLPGHAGQARLSGHRGSAGAAVVPRMLWRLWMMQPA